MYDELPYITLPYEDTECTCDNDIDLRISFVPVGSEYNLPKTIPCETTYIIYWEGERPSCSRTREIVEETAFGFIPVQTDIPSEELLQIVAGYGDMTMVHNPRIKGSQLYADAVLHSLKMCIEQAKGKTPEVTKKPNPHVGRRKKRR